MESAFEETPPHNRRRRGLVTVRNSSPYAAAEGRAAARKADPMPTTSILVLHDDGRWYVAQLLGQHRDRETGDWRCGVAQH